MSPMNNRLMRPLASRGFTPLQLTNLVAWYDASDSSSVIRSGSNVSEWRDKGPNGLHLQPDAGGVSGGGPPQYGATSFNSRPGISFFDGRSAGRTGVSVTAGGYYGTAVNGRASPATFNSYHMWYGGDTRAFGLTMPGDTGFFSNPMPSAVWRNGESRTPANSGTLAPINTPFVVSIHIAPVALTTVRIGNFDGFTFGGSALHSEVIVTSSALDTATRQTVEAYLRNKWGIA